MIKLYQNKEWLYNKYWIENLSLSQIAKLCKTTQTTIQYWMKKFEIKLRSIGEAQHLRRSNHCKLKPRAIEFLSGEFLGDGGLTNKNNYSAVFEYGSKHKEYAEYISNILDFFGIKQVGKIYEYCHKNFDCFTYHYHSRYYVELLPIYKKWYPKGKKIVPKDIELTPLTCRQWYIGDGCLRPATKKCRPHINLATCGFLISGVEFLVEKLNELGFKATRQPSDNTIHIWAKSTKDFLDYIGKCPVKCYQYKWAY